MNLEKIPTADFHVDIFNPKLEKILDSPEFSYATKRANQLPAEGLKKVDLIFASVYKRLNEGTNAAAPEGSEDIQGPVREDLYKIIEFAKASENFKIIQKPEDLELEEAGDQNNILLHLEGGDIITGPEVVDELHKRGIRSIGPLYSHDNQLGGGASGDENKGLTPLGEEVIQRMIERGMIIDVSHANQKTANDILGQVGQYEKTVATHTAFGDKQRFITQDLMKKISEKGGVVGFTPAKPFFPTLDKYIENFKRASDISGSADNMAIGSDFGGLNVEHLYKELDNIGGLSIIAEKLSEQGNFNDEEIEKIMYGNIAKVVKRINKKTT